MKDDNIENNIKKYFSDYKNPAKFTKLLKTMPDIFYSYCKDILDKNSNWQKISFVVLGILKSRNLKHCRACGKEMKWSKFSHDFCCRKCSQNSNQVRQKMKQTCLVKYGVEYSGQAQVKKENTVKSIQKKYGSVKFFYEKTQKTRQDTCLRKYGVETVFSRQQDRKNILQRGWERIKTWKDFVIPMFQQNGYAGRKHIYKWKCVRCGKIFKSTVHSTFFNELDQVLPRCLACFPHIQDSGISKKENELYEFCMKFYKGKIIRNDRQILDGKQLDIYIPQLGLAIQFNGCWFHSMEFHKSQRRLHDYFGYHLNKSLKCKQLGIRLIHVWQDQWDNGEICEFLKEILTGNQKINPEDKIFQLDRYPFMLDKGTVLMPQMKLRYGFHCQDCGKVILENK